MPPRVRDIIRLIEEDGWYFVRQRGSHRQYHHHVKPGVVTIAGNLSHEPPKRTYETILKQAGLKR